MYQWIAILSDTLILIIKKQVLRAFGHIQCAIIDTFDMFIVIFALNTDQCIAILTLIDY